MEVTQVIILKKKGEDGEPSQSLSRCLATGYPIELCNPMSPTLRCWFLHSSTPHYTRDDSSAQLGQERAQCP